MAERSQHRASEGLEGRRERPATGMGSPELKAIRGRPQVTNLCYEKPEPRNTNSGKTGGSGGLAPVWPVP